MKGLLLKDLYIIKHIYAKNLILVLVLYSFLGVTLKMPFFFNMMGWMFSFYTVGLLSAENSSRWDFYAATLPMSKALIVGEKFVLLLLCSLAGLVYSALMAPLMELQMGTPVAESLLTAATISLMVLLFFGAMMPFVYKFGVEKGRMGLILVMAAIGGGVMFLDSTDMLSSDTPVEALHWLVSHPALALVFLGVLAVAVYLVCWLISIAIYRKKEF